MLKEVGASGQISLGKKFAGRLFEVIIHPDDHIEMVPMKAVPHTRQIRPDPVATPDSWTPPGGYQTCTQWSLDNRQALEAYAAQIEHEGTAAEQLQQYLAGQADSATS
jgi:hypothetical protein